MAIPTRVKGVQPKTGTVQNIITWTAVTGAATYKIYIDDKVAPLATGIAGTTYTHNVEVSEAHVYRVAAVNGDGEGVKSDPIRAVGGSETHVYPLSLAGLS